MICVLTIYCRVATVAEDYDFSESRNSHLIANKLLFGKLKKKLELMLSLAKLKRLRWF